MDSYYNPYQPQQRPMYQPQQRPVYQQPQPMPQQEMFNVRLASSREEAVATQGDYFNPTIILGLNHDTIYIKRFNRETGEMLLDGYIKCAEATQTPQYATVDQLQQLRDAVADAINRLRGETAGE